MGLKLVDEMTECDRDEIDSDAVRSALQLLSDKGYVIYKNGYKLVLTGEHSWTWSKVQ